MHFNPIAILQGLFLRAGVDPPAFIGLIGKSSIDLDIYNTRLPSSETKFKEFEPRLKYETRFKHGSATQFKFFNALDV